MSCLDIAQRQSEPIYLRQSRRGQHFFHTFEKSLMEENGHHGTVASHAYGWAMCPCAWTAFATVTCALDRASGPAWGCWQCHEEWSCWAVSSGNPPLARTRGLGSPPDDCWRREDSHQWLSEETAHQASNEVYCQKQQVPIYTGCTQDSFNSGKRFWTRDSASGFFRLVPNKERTVVCSAEALCPLSFISLLASYNQSPLIKKRLSLLTCVINMLFHSSLKETMPQQELNYCCGFKQKPFIVASVMTFLRSLAQRLSGNIWNITLSRRYNEPHIFRLLYF